jgi:hypothetical protein|tara:strand:- start:289 stop:813 length:525 start_codon:yes stop_codon:yes gene_type:complete
MFIWSDNIKLPHNLYDEIVNKIEKNYSNREKFYTSFYEDGYKFADLLVPYYGNLIEKIMRDLGMFKRTTYKYNLWVQMYNSETTTHEPHEHFTGNEILSFNHIINSSNEKCFYFLDDDNNKTYPGNQQTGDIFAWCPWLMHGVDKVKETNTNRLIVAGNVWLKTYQNRAIITRT